MKLFWSFLFSQAEIKVQHTKLNLLHIKITCFYYIMLSIHHLFTFKAKTWKMWTQVIWRTIWDHRVSIKSVPVKTIQEKDLVKMYLLLMFTIDVFDCIDFIIIINRLNDFSSEKNCFGHHFRFYLGNQFN